MDAVDGQHARRHHHQDDTDNGEKSRRVRIVGHQIIGVDDHVVLRYAKIRANFPDPLFDGVCGSDIFPHILKAEHHPVLPVFCRNRLFQTVPGHQHRVGFVFLVNLSF